MLRVPAGVYGTGGPRRCSRPGAGPVEGKPLESLILVSTVALVVNVPLGWWRAATRRLSWQWFVSLHMAVPLVIGLRLALDLPMTYIPVLVATAVLGQFTGTRLRKKVQMPER